MNPLNLGDVTQYVEQNIGDFHKRRILNLEKLELTAVLQKKNPYLFKAKNLLTAEMVVRQITDAHLSSNEETILGGWLEGLAIFINSSVYDGRKSGIPGIDLEFDLDRFRYIVVLSPAQNGRIATD